MYPKTKCSTKNQRKNENTIHKDISRGYVRILPPIPSSFSNFGHSSIRAFPNPALTTFSNSSQFKIRFVSIGKVGPSHRGVPTVTSCVQHVGVSLFVRVFLGQGDPCEA